MNAFSLADWQSATRLHMLNLALMALLQQARASGTPSHSTLQLQHAEAIHRNAQKRPP